MDCSELESCLESKADEDWKNWKNGPIQIAAKLNETEILEKLLNDCGFDINAIDKKNGVSKRLSVPCQGLSISFF